MTTTSLHGAPAGNSDQRHRVLFATGVLLTAAAAWALAACAPLGFSVVIVFLFAGPHNWMEARTLLERMPPRWGPLWPFFLTGIVGVLLLTGALAVLPWWAAGDVRRWVAGAALWNTALVGWVLTLVLMRSGQCPRRDWLWTVPVGLAAVALGWLWPRGFGLALVYLHPLVAFWFLDRELLRRRPAWRGAYHICLLVIAALAVLLWLRLSDALPIDGADPVARRVARHAGADIFTGVDSRLLVGTHAFLEMLHYAVWIVAVPAVGLRALPWKVGSIPLTRRSRRWAVAVPAILLCGGLVAVGFWAGFLVDYARTRDVYFTVATLHVLAEVPFLLRAL